MKIKHFLRYYFPVVAWMALIFLLSSIPGNGFDGEKDFWFYLQRKGAHVFEYFVLSILFARVFFWRGCRCWRSLVFAGIVSLLYAASDEFHQTFIFDREGKFSDVLIDSTGIVLGLLVFKVIIESKFERIKNFLS